MDPLIALAQLGGVANAREWRRLVGNSRAVRRAIAEGHVVMLARWQVALADIDAAHQAAAEVGGTVGHLSAALHHGWKVKAPPVCPTIIVPRHRHTPDLHLDCHLRYADLSPADVEIAGSTQVTSPVRTVIDCARTYDRAVALSVADSALRSGKVTNTDLTTAARQSPRTGRHRALWVASHATDLAANPFESALRAIALGVSGLKVRPQGWIGNTGRADLVDERLLIAIEADSWQYHADEEPFRRDVRRYTDFARLGWVVVRFVWEDVMHKAERVQLHLTQVAQVRARQLGLPVERGPSR